MAYCLPNGFTLTGHTGCLDMNGVKTEDNSLASIDAAAACGANIVEIDVRFLQDGTAVLSHDSVSLVTDVVTLDAAFEKLASYPMLKMNVDLKSIDNVKIIKTVADRYGVTDRIFFTGVDAQWAKAIAVADTGIPYFLNIGINKLLKNNSFYIRRLIKLCKELGCMGLNINKNGATKKISRLLHENGLMLSVWTCTKDNEIRAALECSPDNITSRNPALVKKILSE